MSPSLGSAARTGRLSVLLALAAVVASTSCGDLLGPEGFQCASRDGIEICTDREAYRPGSTLTFTISSSRAEPVWVCLCSIAKEVADRNDQNWQEVVYSPNRNCGVNPSEEVLAANRRELSPGTSITDSVVVYSFVQAVYRLNIWLFDAEGNFVDEAPFQSGKFDMFPSAEG